MSLPPSSSDRRLTERRLDSRIADLSLPEMRRIAVTFGLFVVVLALFLWMVRQVIIAAILGVVIAIYLRPTYGWLQDRVRLAAVAGVLTLVGAIVPFLAVVLYGYVEVLKVAKYIVTNEGQVAAQLAEAARRLPWVDGAEAAETVRQGMATAARFAERIPAAVGEAAGGFSVDAAIFLFTAFYVLTQREQILGYLRGHIPPRYAELVGALRENVVGVLYGAVFSTFVTQSVKSGVVFVLFLIFDVPLAAVLAIVAFVIGFFPVVGSWSVYLPVAAWLVVFRDEPFAALTVIAVGLFVNTLFLSFYLRPKLAAEKSQVLNFYWMLVGLVTGVYTFGLAGLLLGPILIGLLKAIWDTVTTPSSWRLLEE
jgi:predicted PurR-regulated permease PerM